ncbi:hypothetical protein SUDANB121_00005 [Nocardiopsis dassonvillei]
MRLSQLLSALIRGALAPPPQGRHARSPRSDHGPDRRYPQPQSIFRAARHIPITRPPRWSLPFSAAWQPTTRAETPVRPYYRAWEEERHRRAQDRDRLGIAVLREIATSQRQHPGVGV